jgi:hypothetical protein
MAMHPRGPGYPPPQFVGGPQQMQVGPGGAPYRQMYPVQPGAMPPNMHMRGPGGTPYYPSPMPYPPGAYAYPPPAGSMDDGDHGYGRGRGRGRDGRGRDGRRGGRGAGGRGRGPGGRGGYNTSYNPHGGPQEPGGESSGTADAPAQSADAAAITEE